MVYFTILKKQFGEHCFMHFVYWLMKSYCFYNNYNIKVSLNLHWDGQCQ